MNLNINNIEIDIEFEENLLWFEEEFDLIFNNKLLNYDIDNINLANQLLDNLSETIIRNYNEKRFYHLVSTLNNIEKKLPEFF